MSASPDPGGEPERVYSTLCRLGLSANYRGFYQMAYALQLAQAEPERLLLVTKSIYPDVARRCRTTRAAVERNLRTAVKVIWRADTPLFRKIMGEGNRARPSTARFLSLLTAYLAEEGAAPGVRP